MHIYIDTYLYKWNKQTFIIALMLESSKVKFFSILDSWDRTFVCHTNTE